MLWGVVAALVANVLFSAGFVIEKRALSALPPLSATRPAQVVLHLLRSPLWVLGAASLLLGFAAQLAVYRALPLIAAQGLFVTGLVMLLLLSALFLGERSSGRERQGMVAIVVALVMIVLSLRDSTEEIGRVAPVPLLLAICLPSLVFSFTLFLAAERRSRRRHRMPTSGVPYGVAVGVLYGVSSLAIKGLAGLIDPADPPGTLSAVLTSPYPYLLLCTGSTGLVLSQTALQRCRASLIVPVCTTVNFLFAVVAGSLAFAEPLPGEPLRLALRLGGAALAVSVLLTLPRHDTAPAPAPVHPDGPERLGSAGNLAELPLAGRPLTATPHPHRTYRHPGERSLPEPTPTTGAGAGAGTGTDSAVDAYAGTGTDDLTHPEPPTEKGADHARPLR